MCKCFLSLVPAILWIEAFAGFVQDLLEQMKFGPCSPSIELPPYEFVAMFGDKFRGAFFQALILSSTIFCNIVNSLTLPVFLMVAMGKRQFSSIAEYLHCAAFTSSSGACLTFLKSFKVNFGDCLVLGQLLAL